MKKNFSLFIFPLLFICTMHVNAQNPVGLKPCVDTVLSKTADSLMHLFKTNSFTFVHGASLTMESEYESPILVKLNKENRYVIAFVGAKSSKLFEVRIYDGDDNRVAFEKQKGFDKDGNILMFAFKPEASGYFMIKPMQVGKKNKDICGQIMLFRKNPTAGYQSE